MRREIRVLETVETVTILSSTVQDRYRIIWHRTDGKPEEEFHIEVKEGDNVEEAVAEDLKARMGP